jgi:transcriptional regulator with XRE-family HTH domain
MASALQRLITERKAEMRWSYGDIARRGGMSRSTVHKLATSSYEGLPRYETMTLLARGLGLPLSTVREAAMQSVRTRTTRTRTSQGREILLGHAAELTDEQVEHVNRYIDMMFGSDQ